MSTTELTERRAVCAALIVALLFGSVASIRLGVQGLNYDELHQATGAFAYLGAYPEHFSLVRVFGLPLMNMSYSAGIKTALYGAWMRVSGASFSPESWRLCGIIIAMIALFGFSVRLSIVLPRLEFAILSFLIISDATLLLLVRHDYGPVALALLFRLGFLSTWLACETGKGLRRGGAFLLGLWVGLAIVEKLSSCVLILVLVVVIARAQDRRISLAFSGAKGFLLGISPLALINAYTLWAGGYAISFRDVDSSMVNSHGFASFLKRFLSLGSGVEARAFVLGDKATVFPAVVEMTLVVSAIAIVAMAAWRSSSVLIRSAGTAVFAYVAVGVGLLVLPGNTLMWHWVIGTPIQYMAIALGLAGLRGPGAPVIRWMSPALSAVVAALCFARLLRLFGLVLALWVGQYSKSFDPSLTNLGRFAASCSEDVVFLTTSWGVGTQIYCLADGRSNHVREHSRLDSIDRLRAYLNEQSGKRVFYLVGLASRDDERMVSDAKNLPDWREVPVEPEAQGRAIRIRKFMRDAAAVPGGTH